MFNVLGLIPGGPRPTRTDIFGSLAVNYKLVLNLAGVGILAPLLAHRSTSRRPGLRDEGRPRQSRHRDVPFYFCSNH